MAELAEGHDQALEGEARAIEESLAKLRGNHQNELLIGEIEIMLQSMNKELSGLKVVVRAMKQSDPALFSEWSGKEKQHKAKEAQLKKEFAEAKHGRKRPVVIDDCGEESGPSSSGGNGSARPSGSEEHPGERKNDAAIRALDEGIELQGDMKGAQQRILIMGRDAQMIAEDTGQELREQAEIIGVIEEEQETLKEQLVRARQDVVWFRRRAMKDRCFLCLCCIVASSLLGIIIYHIVLAVDGGDDSSSSTPME